MNLNGFEMTDTSDRNTPTVCKYFTVDEARATLPLVQRIVTDIVEQYGYVLEHHGVLQKSGLNEEQRATREASRSRATEKFNELSEELSNIGCELKDWDTGLVDFPARRGGRDVCLCWKLGEETIDHWHEVKAGFAGREQIMDEAEFAA